MRTLGAILVLLVASGCRPESEKPLATDDPRIATGLPALAESLLARGHASYKAGEYEAARDLWLALLPRTAAGRDSTLEAELYTWLGLANYRLGNSDSASLWELRALAIKAKLARPHELWRSYNALGLITLDQNLNDSAAFLFEKASAVAHRDGDPGGVAKATGNAALAYSYLGDLRRARSGHRAMRVAGASLGDDKIEANGIANEAMVDIWEGDAASAIARLDTARTIYRTTRDVVGEANALGQLATAYELTGDFSASFAALDSALDITRRHRLSANTIEMLRLLGSLHSRLGDHRRAIAFFDQAEGLARSSGANSDLASILRGAAWSSFRLGNVRRGRAKAQEALARHIEAEERLDEIDDLLLLAEIDAVSGDRAAARTRIGIAAGRAAETGNVAARATVLLAQAAMAAEEGRAGHALTLLRRVAADTLRVGFEVQSSAAALASRAFLQLGQPDSAVAAGARAVEAVEYVRATLTAPAVRSSWISDRARVYSDYIVALLRSGKTEEAFVVADRARSRALIQNLGVVRGTGTRGLPQELFESERVLRRIDALMTALAKTTPPQSDSRGRLVADAAQPIVARLAAARDEFERLQIMAAEKGGTRGELLEPSVVEAARLRSVLAPEEAVLEYFLGADSLFSFVVTRNGVRVARTAINPDHISQRLRLLKELWGSPRNDWAVGLGISQALHEDLIAPVKRAGLLKGVRRIVIVPHGMLAQVPYAGLQDAGPKTFFIEEFDIGEAPSSAALVALRQRSSTVSHAGSIVALAPFGRELPGTAREVAMIGAVGKSSRVWLNAKATEGGLRRELGGGRMIHVATHGVLNHLNPMFSRIELTPAGNTTSDNGRLEVHELLSIEVRSPLIFLSGCETGSSEEWSDAIRATGDLTLSQAFLSAGALNVVSTLWRIDDHGAAEIAIRFYSAVRHMPLFEALSGAQRSVRSNPKFRNPYYWAGYVLSGNGRRITGPQKPQVVSVH